MTRLAAPPRSRLFDATIPALVVGVVALVVCIVFGRGDALPAMLRAWLFAFIFVLGIPLGAMAILMLHHLTDGAWGWPIRRPAEAAAMTLPLLAIFFIPIALNLSHLYPWADVRELAGSAILQSRRPVFNPAAFILRAYIFFALWFLLAWRLRSLSLRAEQSKLRRVSALGLVLYILTMSMAAIDWIMSLEPEWYSTVYALIVITGQSLVGLTFLLLILAPLRRLEPLAGVADDDAIHDLGNLLLTVVILWAYLAFAQFLVNWLGNMQDEITWYIHRTQGPWRLIAIALMLLHFFVPFILLLQQPAKRNMAALASLAAVLLVMHILDVLWQIAPSPGVPHRRGHAWLYLPAFVAAGGIWFALFLHLLRRQPLLPEGQSVPIRKVDHGPATT